MGKEELAHLCVHEQHVDLQPDWACIKWFKHVETHLEVMEIQADN